MFAAIHLAKNELLLLCGKA